MSQSSVFVHLVFFYLRENADPGDADRIAEGCRRHLPGIPGVLRLEIGRTAGTPRAVVDNAYAVALHVEFADKAAHDVYQEHPDHKRFIAECSPYWSQVRVYDYITGG